MTNTEAKCPPAGLPESIAEQLDLMVACAKPASGKNSARVAAGIVRDYIADLIRERDEAITRLSQPSGEEICEAALLKAAVAVWCIEVPANSRGDWADGYLTAREAAVAAIEALPLSSGSNKSDEGKKGQTG